MKWCNVINMFCSDMDDEEYEFCGCDGQCEYCTDCDEVTYKGE